MTTLSLPQLVTQAIDKLIEERVKLAILDFAEEGDAKRDQQRVVDSAKESLKEALQTVYQNVFDSLKTLEGMIRKR